MFYLTYLYAELTRRWGKTLTISLGLALSSAIIIAIISISQSLSSAQNKVLNPLQNVGTDIMVSRSINSENMRDLDETTRSEMMKENRISIDLSKLGDPGEQFSLDTFLPGTLLTFAAKENIQKLDSSLVKNYALGLILNVNHQESKIPQVTAQITTGGETFEVRQQMSDEQRQQMQEAMKKAEDEVRAKGLDPRSEEGRVAVRELTVKYMPELSTRFTTPERTYNQDVGSISTDIDTSSFTVAGVDTQKTDIGLILPSQIIEGKYFHGGTNQIIVNKSYADKNSTKIGDKFTLNKKESTVIGIVEPKLYTNTADFYLPLTDLQTLTDKNDRINILLVKSTDAQTVSKTSESLANLFQGAQITDATDTAKEVSGSLINASNLIDRFIALASILVILASFIIVSLITILSVNKRVREIGTLKALGWSNTMIIRQIMMENLLLGLLGAVLGIGLGILIIYLLNHYDINLSANFAQSNIGFGPGLMRRFSGTTAPATSSTNIKLQIEYFYLIMTLGAATAILGSLIAGTVAASKSAKMKPQEALRKVE